MLLRLLLNPLFPSNNFTRCLPSFTSRQKQSDNKIRGQHGKARRKKNERERTTQQHRALNKTTTTHNIHGPEDRSRHQDAPRRRLRLLLLRSTQILLLLVAKEARPPSVVPAPCLPPPLPVPGGNHRHRNKNRNHRTRIPRVFFGLYWTHFECWELPADTWPWRTCRG